MSNKDWRMVTPCNNCPFSKDGPGLQLRRSLAPGRWKEITDNLKRECWFACHKTTLGADHDGCDTGVVFLGKGVKMCAGAIAYQEQHGVSSNLQRVCENLDWVAEQRERKKARA